MHKFRGELLPAWFGAFPSESEQRILPVRYLFEKFREIPGPGRADAYQRLSLTMNGVLPRSREATDGLQPESFDSYQLLKPGQLVFKLIDLQNVSTSRVGLSDAEGLVSPAYIVVEPSKRVIPRFAYWYFMDLYFRRVFNSLGEDGVRTSLGWEGLKELPFPLLSIQKQEKITRFLDVETAKIDHLITKQRKLLRLTEERVVSDIEAVIWGQFVSGNDFSKVNEYSYVPREISSLALARRLSSIPKSWDIQRFKNIFSRRDERNSNSALEMLSLRQTGAIVPRSETGQNQEPSEASIPKYLAVRPGDLVVNPMWLTGGAIGVSERDGAVSPDYRVFAIGDQLLPAYAHEILRSISYRRQSKLFERANTTFDRRIQQIDLDNLPVPIPPKEHQEEIVREVRNIHKRTKKLSEVIKHHIRLALERRSALITAAVTEQIEV